MKISGGGLRRLLLTAAVAILAAAAGACGDQSTPTGRSSADTDALPIASDSSPGPHGLSLGRREWIAAIERTPAGGAVLTDERLLIADGGVWRECSHPTGSTFAGPFVLVAVSPPLVTFAAGGMLWTTRDDCRTWNRFLLPRESVDLSFDSPDDGFVVVSDWVSERETARVYHTVDGGRTWEAAAGRVAARAADGNSFHGFLGLSFSDARHGLLSSYTGLWTTNDAGATWLPVKLPGSANPALSEPVAAADGSAAIAAGAPGALTFYTRATIDAEWVVAATIPDATGDLRLQMDLHSPRLWVLRESGEFRATSDGGLSWTTATVNSSWPFGASKSSFADPRHGWLVVAESGSTCPEATVLPGSSGNDVCDYGFMGHQHLYGTDDGGETWHEALP